MAHNLPAKMRNDEMLKSFMAMPDEQHREAIMTLKGDIGERLLRMGKAVYAWKLKGHDLDQLGMNGMADWLLMVGGDELYAPLLAKVLYKKEMARRLSKLSFAEQQHIGDGGKVPLLILAKDGTQDSIEVCPVEVQDMEQLDQLLGEGHFRTLAQQRQYIEAKRAKAAKPVPQRIGHLAPDPDRDGCEFLGKRGDFISADTLLAAYRACRKKERIS